MVKTYQLGQMLLLLVLTITGKAWGVGDYLGPPISSEEIATAMANPSLKAPPPDGVDAIEHSGEFQGDIKITSAQQAQMRMGGRSAILVGTWQNGEIPYTISSVFTTSERQVIALAMAEYETRTCLKFVDRTTETDYISIISDSGCWSYVGRIGGQQSLSLRQNGCLYFGIAIHEFMHASGFWHEQSRYDRDKYVTINSENIQSGKEHNFAKRNKEDTTHLGLKYDYGSVMHYSAYAFSSNGNPTITSKPPGVTLGQRGGFSLLDVSGLNRLYNCKDFCITDGGTRVGGQCLFFEDDSKTWEEAVKSCNSKGQELVTLFNPPDLKAYMKSNYGYYEAFWLGASDSANEGKWVWIDGRPFDSFPWEFQQPDNNQHWGDSGGQDCLAVGWQHTFDDKACTESNRYICELKDSTVCPEGFFRQSNQCFKFYPQETGSFTQVSSFCDGEGLKMAHPRDPIGLRRMMVPIYGPHTEPWINVLQIGDSNDYQWQDDNTILPSSSSLWFPGQPEEYGQGCVILLVWDWRLDTNPDQPYYARPCSGYGPPGYGYYALCELVWT